MGDWLAIRLLAQFRNDPNCAGRPNCGADTVFPQVGADPNTMRTLLQITFGILGAVALIVVMIAAIKFVVSAGDPQATSKARQTIIYALIGLAVAIAAEAIVTLVVNRI